MRKLKIRMIMYLLHSITKRRKDGAKLFYIKGSGRDFPKYLMYTEDIITAIRLDRLKESITE